MGVTPQGAAADCNSVAEKHARFDSWGTHQNAQVAQLVEQRTENPRVGGSIPSLGTITGSKL
jgi:hypothetical protein